MAHMARLSHHDVSEGDAVLVKKLKEVDQEDQGYNSPVDLAFDAPSDIRIEGDRLCSIG